MNRPILLGLVASLLFLVSGCSTVSVTTDYNPSYNFADLKSYAWLDDGKPPSEDARINNEMIAERVRKAVEKNLAARGYVKAEGDSADFMVTWFGAIDKKMQVESIDHFYSPYGYGPLHRDPALGSSAQAPSAYEYQVGTLIIDILDPVEHKLIWRGSGNDRIREQKNPQDRGKGINRAVAQIMKDFPPPK